ncbi:alcohol dehydrogenase class-3-like [Lineus longissimus]|uniref:alcohol dehydrogenase class-3-like n=1 Tax=Lineus longissimus TaxID=88925 RepID=UPI002B4E5AD2
MADTTGKTITCKAAVAWGVNKPLIIETVDVAPPKAGEARIKMICTSICHSDAHNIWREEGKKTFPIVLGHEGAGVVESIGEGVTTLKPGDHVIPIFLPNCGECKPCKSQDSNMCQKFDLTVFGHVMRDGTTRITLKDGRSVLQMAATGTFSEYTVINEIQLAKIDKAAPMEKVCLIGCGFSTGYGAALNTAKVKPGSSCAIWGMGGIGLSAAMGCKANGATKIIGVDINDDKKTKALEVGCTDFVNPTKHEKAVELVLGEMTGGGCDYTFECIGNNRTMSAALKSARPGGGLAVILGVTEVGSTAAIGAWDLVAGRTLTGCFFGGYKGRESIPRLVNEFQAGKITLDPLITHQLKLEEINTGFDMLKEGKCIRTLVTL